MKNGENRTTCHLCAGCDPNCPCCGNGKREMQNSNSDQIIKEENTAEEAMVTLDNKS